MTERDEFTASANNETVLSLTPETIAAEMPQISAEMADKFYKYYNLLIEWNQRMNLTRITEPMEVVRKHFADSVLGESLIPHGARVIDVGTGAGFPGVPLAIVRPDIELVLVDSLGKRIRFLDELLSSIGVRARTIHARAEDAARMSDLRERFDVSLSRAVAPMNVLTELTIPFVKVGGASLMYKSAGAEEEIAACGRAFRVLNCTAETVVFDVPWGARNIVVARKTAPTPGKYPRKAGFIEKAPL